MEFERDRAASTAKWRRRGYERPKRDGDKYDIQHIQPRDFVGTNDSWSLVSVEGGTHRAQFNSFCQVKKGKGTREQAFSRVSASCENVDSGTISASVGQLARDIRDVRSLFGRKYNVGMQEMLDYAKTLPEFQK